MKTIELKKVKEGVKKNQPVETIEPNITESCYLVEDGEVIGFYLSAKDVPERIKKIATLVNNELLSSRVPKSVMNRVTYDDLGNAVRLKQFSAIIGAVQQSPFKRRYKPGLSHLHLEKSAEKYIKLKYLFAKECEQLVKDIAPELYEKQKQALSNQQIKIANLWTSGIDNFNGSVNTHIDGGNIKGTNNIIYFKRKNSTGGNLHIPEYGGVVNSEDNSMVFYPAYKHIHAVDKIQPLQEGGYRNSIVLYPLNIKYD